MGNTEIRLNPEKVQAIITDLTTFRNEKINPGATIVAEANSDVSWPCSLGGFTINVTGHSENLRSKIADLQTCLDAAKAANDSGMTTKNPDGTIAYVVADGHRETIENIKKDNPIEDWHAAKKDVADLEELSTKGESVTAEEWNGLLQRMQTKQDDPEYAAIMLNIISLDKLLDLPIDFEKQFSVGTDAGVVNLMPNAKSDLSAVFGHIIATRSHTWDANEAKNYADRLVSCAEENNKGARIDSLNAMLSASHDDDVDGDGSNESVGLDYNDAFLLTLANRLENFKAKGGVDGRRISFQEANSLEGVVHAMTGNPEAAEQWLTVHSGDGQVDIDQTAERTRSLINKATLDGWFLPGTWSNQWEEDWLMLAARHAVEGVDDPAGGPQHAAVTSAVLNTIGENAEYHTKMFGDGDPYMTLTERGRNAASIALASYPYAVQVAGSSDDQNNSSWVLSLSGNPWGQEHDTNGNYYQPQIHRNALRSFLGEIGQDDAAVARYTSAQESFNKMQLERATGQDTSEFTAALNAQAALRGFTSASIVRQSEMIKADANERLGAFAEATSMAISAVPLPQAKAGGAALSAVTKFAMNFGKAAAAKGAESGINAMFGGTDDSSHYMEQGQQANIEFQTLSVLQMAYTKEERKRIYLDNRSNDNTSGGGNDRIDISSIIGPDGELKIDPSQVNPGEDGNEDNHNNSKGSNSTALTGDQRNALKYLSDHLPQDGTEAVPEEGKPGRRAHPGVANFSEDRNTSYKNGYNNVYVN